MGWWRHWIGGRETDRALNAVHDAVVAQARQPAFYRDCGVPDTMDGRFDLLALHAFLVLHRLRGEGKAGQDFGQRLLELIVTDLDRAMREAGSGDLGVAPRVKAMVKGIGGRIGAYHLALEQTEDTSLLAALDNNLYGTVLNPLPAHLGAMARYVRDAVTGLASQSGSALLAGQVSFPPPPSSGIPA